MHPTNIQIPLILFYINDPFLTCKEKLHLFLQLHKVPSSTFYRWLHLYKSNKLNVINGTSKKTRRNKVSRFILIYIKRIVSKLKVINVNKIIFGIHNIFNVTISKSYFYKLLHMLHLSYKKMYIKHMPINSLKLKDIINKFRKNVNTVSINNIASIDETSIYLHWYPNKGWSYINTKCLKTSKNNTFNGQKYTLLMAISNNKILKYKLYKNSVNSSIYLDFIKDLVKCTDNKYFLLMDNARIHVTKLFKQYVIDNHVNVIYNIPYNPESNPIELIFSPIKNYIKRHNTTSIEHINNSITDYLKNVQSNMLNNFFVKALDKYYTK